MFRVLGLLRICNFANRNFTAMQPPAVHSGQLPEDYPWQLKKTADGSDTLYNHEFKQYYHSIFGARQETHRVFIELGLQHAFSLFERVNLLEVGFGTGFNAWATALETTKIQRQVNYTGLEPYPVKIEAINTLKNFSENDALQQVAYEDLHSLSWDQQHVINEFFSFQKRKTTLQDHIAEKQYNLIYYDAFAPISQPELWTVETFRKVADLLINGGILTTYCAKGFVQRNLKAAGFKVEKHPGPPRKREVIRAILM